MEDQLLNQKFLREHEGFQRRWRDIFRNLNVPLDIIKERGIELVKSVTTLEEVYNACLKSWRDVEGEDATIRKLISILCRFQLDDIASAIQEEFGVEPESSKKLQEPLLPSVTWSNLGNERKEILIYRSVTIQQRMTSLKNIFDEMGLSEKSVDIFLDKYLDQEFLADLHYDRNPIILRDTLPAKTHYYIQRTLLSRRRISKNIFEKRADIFLVSGVERHDLSTLVGKEISDTSRRQVKKQNLTARLILLEMESDFIEICQKTEKPVHWLEHKGGAILWRKTQGDLGAIQACILTEQEHLKESEFLSNIEKQSHDGPVCISESTGMGKSTLLANLGSELRTKHPDRVVIFVILSHFIDKMKTCEINLNYLVESLLELYCTTPLEFEVGRLFFKCKEIKTEILFDGFDEVSHEDVNITLKCLQLINFLPGVRLWVTTQPQHRDVLENTLQTMAYNIQPFPVDNQECLLVHHWSQSSVSGGPTLNERKLLQYATACLEKLREIVKAKESYFPGLPLQCLLVSEVFAKDAVNFSNPGNDTIQVPPISIQSTLDLFDQFIKKKLELFAELYLQGRSLTPDKVKDFENSHIFHATQVMNLDDSNRLNLVAPLPLKTLLRVGLLQVSEDGQPPQFIHRTFAEYFVAKFIHQVITENRDLSEIESGPLSAYPVIIQEINNFSQRLIISCDLTVYSFTSPLVMYFLNCLIDSEETPYPSNMFFSDFQIDSILSASVCENYLSIFKWLRKSPNFSERVTSEHIFLSILYGDLELFEAVIDIYLKTESTPIPLITRGYDMFDEPFSLLRVAARSGNYPIFQNLLKKHSYEEILRQEDSSSKYVVHDCVNYSDEDNHDVITAKEKIIAEILKINKSLLEVQREDLLTPLLGYKIHFKLLNKLISSGANLLPCDETGYCILSKIAEYLSSELYDKLIRNIPVDIFRKLISFHEGTWEDPIYSLLWCFEPLISTLEYCKEERYDFSYYNGAENASLVEVAIKRERSVSCINKLIEFGASVDIDSEGGNLLHVAADYRHMELLKSYCSDYNINSRDKHENTPLHRCLETQGELFSTIELIISLGGDVNATDIEGNTAFHIASANHWVDREVCEVLLEKKATINAKNIQGHTPLMHGLCSPRGVTLEKLSLFRSLEEINSKEIATLALYNVICQQIEDEMAGEYFELAEYCMLQGADMNFINEDGLSFFQSAVQWRCSYGVQFLLEKGYGEDIVSMIRKDANMFDCVKLINEGENGTRYYCKRSISCIKHCNLIWGMLKRN